MAAPLTAQDRCDAGQCRAQALCIAVMPSGNTLLFCRHHGLKYAEGLTEQGAVLETHYESLKRQPYEEE